MKTNKLITLIFSLLLFCNLAVAEQSSIEQTADLTQTVEKSLSPKDFMTEPDKLLTVWGDEPIPLSSYTDEEKRLQKYINEKTATAVATYSPKSQEKEWTKYDHEEITPYTWKVLDLRLTESNGKTFDISLLRPHWWMRNIGADKVGNRFYLKIPDVEEGWAVVKAIRINQLDTRLWDEARNGDFVYRPVTATFKHESNNVLQLYFGNNQKPLGVTPEHPIYSIDRNDYISAGKLKIGEQVKTRQGLTTLTEKKQLAGTHPVYNLEIYRDHNYMVSMDSIFVHNKGGKGKTFTVDPSLQPADRAKNVLIGDNYVKNSTAKPINDMINPQSGRIGNKQTNGNFMYVVDTKGNIIIGSRGKDLDGGNLKMPHPTLIGGKKPEVLGAGMVDIRAGKIHSVNLESGHYKPSNDALKAVQEAFNKLPKKSFDNNFNGFVPYKEQ